MTNPNASSEKKALSSKSWLLIAFLLCIFLALFLVNTMGKEQSIAAKVEEELLKIKDRKAASNENFNLAVYYNSNFVLEIDHPKNFDFYGGDTASFGYVMVVILGDNDSDQDELVSRFKKQLLDHDFSLGELDSHSCFMKNFGLNIPQASFETQKIIEEIYPNPSLKQLNFSVITK